MTPSRSHHRSPKLARAMLARCIPSSVREPVIGDFEEEFGEVVERYGSIRAAAWYWRQAIWSIGACLSGLLGEQLRSIHRQFDMAATQLIRHRCYSISSTAGLALAFTCCLLLSLYLAHELSYDRYHENGDRIFRVIAGAENSTPPILGPTLQRDDPYVERATRILFPPQLVFRVAGGGKVEETGSLVFGDRETFDIFNWRFKDRMGGRLLEDLRTVVITSSAAARLFKARDPIGKTLRINEREFVVAGVVQDIPVNSHFRCDFIVNISNAKELGA